MDFQNNQVKFKANFIAQGNSIHDNKIASNQVEENKIENVNPETEKNVQTEMQWYIQIDSISLKAPIHEGTTQEVMENYVGHFEESPKNIGNVCLAAHNRGYKNNYFNKLKELREGDEIKYKYNNIEKIYIVNKHEIIKNTDWSNLENTEENKITLITCVENEPEYRRCIQGIEKQ